MRLFPRAGSAVVLTLMTAVSLSMAQEAAPMLKVDVRRVRISLGFAGQQVLIAGQAPSGTRQVVSVIEAPPAGEVRLMRKGRRGPFWLGVEQYAVSNVPGLYKVAISCPGGNVVRPCPDRDIVATVNRRLASDGIVVGLDEIVRRAVVRTLRGERSAKDRARLLDGLWKLEASRGLYTVDPNGIHLTGDGRYFCKLVIPAHAPEAKYTITTYFLGQRSLLDAARVELFVSRSGIVAWLARLARRHAYIYGAVTVVIALTAGWFVGVLFRRRRSSPE